MAGIMLGTRETELNQESSCVLQHHGGKENQQYSILSAVRDNAFSSVNVTSHPCNYIKRMCYISEVWLLPSLAKWSKQLLISLLFAWILWLKEPSQTSFLLHFWYFLLDQSQYQAQQTHLFILELSGCLHIKGNMITCTLYSFLKIKSTTEMDSIWALYGIVEGRVDQEFWGSNSNKYSLAFFFFFSVQILELFPVLTLWYEASHIVSLDLGFLTCKMKGLDLVISKFPFSFKNLVKTLSTLWLHVKIQLGYFASLLVLS